MARLGEMQGELNELVIASLFPQRVSIAISGISGLIENLYQEEGNLIRHASQKRQAEFASGRLCTKEILAAEGIYNFPVLMDEKRAPIWPEGISGSIAHTRHFCVAVVTKVKKGQSLGIDIEEDHRLRRDLWGHSLVAEEIKFLNGLDGSQNSVKWATLMFSAKEAFYKAQYPLTKLWIGFKDAKVIIDDVNNFKFYIELLIELGAWKKGMRFEGRYSFLNNYVYAGLLIEV